MIPSKLVSSKECVEKLYTDTASQEFYNSDDIKIWIVEVFGLIKYPLQYMPKVIGYKQDPVYSFTNYRVPLPCDFVSFMPGGISVNGLAVRYNTNSFAAMGEGSCCGLEGFNNTKMDLFTDNFGNEFSPQYFNPQNVTPNYGDITFSLQNEEILFNVKEGKVCLAYMAYPVDSEGYLMIPDTVKYKRAVTDYLIWKTDYIKWRAGELSADVYKESKENKIYSIASAASELKMPDDYQLDSMKNSLIRLIPKINSKEMFYKDLGIQENRKLR